MKKLLAMLALVLAVAMLATCCLAEADPFGKYEEPVTVHFVRSTDDTLDANYFSQHPDKTMTDNLWCDLYRDVLNVNVEYDWIVKGGDEYDQKLNIALGVGDIPEFVNVNTLQLKQLAEADLIMPLEDVYNEYASDFTKEIMLATGTSPFDAATIDGHLYGLPNVDSTLMIADLLWVRTDWLEKLGLPIPTTMDEVIATAKAFCEADFDGDGEGQHRGHGDCEGPVGPAVQPARLLQRLRFLPGYLGGGRGRQPGVRLHAARHQGSPGHAAPDV